MNEEILSRFVSHQRILIECPAVVQYTVIKQRVGSADGHIRVRATLIDGGLLEFSEYVALDNAQSSERVYSLQWQDDQHRLVRRWDNANHHPDLPHAPHHIHQADGAVIGNGHEPDLSLVLRTIEQQLI